VLVLFITEYTEVTWDAGWVEHVLALPAWLVLTTEAECLLHQGVWPINVVLPWTWLQSFVPQLSVVEPVLFRLEIATVLNDLYPEVFKSLIL